ncbi:carboxyltransferase domain-containing protein [Terrilactibacillus sp. S3-3]|nr:carboxyltransferase domain-containing protein [Terrilactibacillus sp. S3-3]
MLENWRITPLGDSAVTVTVTFSEKKIDEHVHSQVLEFAGMLESQPLPGMTDVVSGYTSFTFFFIIRSLSGKQPGKRSKFELKWNGLEPSWSKFNP